MSFGSYGQGQYQQSLGQAYNPQWQPQVSQTVQRQYAALGPGGQGFSSSAFNPPRQSGRQTQPSQMYYGSQWQQRKNRKGTKKGGKSRKNRRSNTMRKGRRTNRK